MKRRLSIFAGVVVALGMMIPSVGHASPSPGVGVYPLFQCQLVILFPNFIPKSPAKTNCDGAAWGVGVGAGKGGSTFVSCVEPNKPLLCVGPLVNPKKPQGQGKFENFEVYNIKYSEICVDGEPFPLIGMANGYAFINGNDQLAAQQGANPNRSIVLHFTYIRVVNVFVALLDDVNAYNNKWPQGGGPKPITGLVGAAFGIFTPKPPLGTCASPNPQQGVIITGHAAMLF